MGKMENKAYWMVQQEDVPSCAGKAVFTDMHDAWAFCDRARLVDEAASDPVMVVVPYWRKRDIEDMEWLTARTKAYEDFRRKSGALFCWMAFSNRMLAE